MTFPKEADFEEALIKVLADKGWEKKLSRTQPSKTSSEIGQRSCMITTVELTA